MHGHLYARKIRALLTVTTILSTLPFVLSESAKAQEATTNFYDTVLPEVTVTGTREEQLKSETPATITTLDGETLRDMKGTHPTEVMGRIPGVHVSITGGEGHMTAIRQPITTSPVYLYLEDGIPTRSTGFFNHNALYEINLPQAGGIEVLKGPGSALQGSDAIGGVINVLTRAPSAEREIEVSAEYGASGFMRAMGSYSDTLGDDALRASVNLTHTDGWRESTQYDRESTTLRWDSFLKGGAMLKTVLTMSNIDQQTAGSSRLRYDDYHNNPTYNYTPISFRKVQAIRLSSAYEKEDQNSLLSLTPYLRWNSMEMLPNWSLGYDPVIYTTGHSSLGLMGKYRRDFAPYRARLVVGADIDFSPGSRDESSINRTKIGNDYVGYSLAEKIYDYDVTFMSASPYAHVEASPVEKLRLSAGLRLDAIRYVYKNNLGEQLTGNHRRYADNTVNFLHLSPKLGATYAFTPRFNAFASYKHAFRAPSAGTLFRSGKSADSLHLNPVKVNSYEVGIRGNPKKGISYELSAYYMVKKDDILTYNDGTNRIKQNAGETLHKGIEVGLGYRFNPEWKLNAALSYSKQTYEEWVASATTDYSGNEMASAPRMINNLTLAYSPRYLPKSNFELEWVHMSEYWMDENNTHKYTGHQLLNFRGSYQVNDTFKVFGRVMNVTDSLYATRASYTSNRLEYAPGTPLTLYAGIEATF